MNRLVIIGNGFDLSHGLNTSYKDFIDWYWNERLSALITLDSHISEDILCKFELPRTPRNRYSIWFVYAQNHNFFRKNYWVDMSIPEILALIEDDEWCVFEKSLLLERITKNIENKGWTDIESDYYELLKENTNDIEQCQNLNKQLDFTREILAEYLRSIEQPKAIEAVKQALNEPILMDDISTQEVKRSLEQWKDIPESECIKVEDTSDIPYNYVAHTMLLSFNYTPTAEIYQGQNTKVNYIHGSLTKPEEMIFGYGDEMDKDFKDLENLNENELLKNSKSVKYLETSHYRDLLSFIEGGPFQVYIMGHSCGNSDRTLLNTIFEHDNCISIKPFCYINENNEDNYSELTRNIYRNFTDKKLFRDRVVNKERCTTLDGQPLVSKDQLVSQ